MSANHRASQPVADLHCDLLAYLVVGAMHGESRSIRDDRCRVSLRQLREGGVALQTLAIFVMTAPEWTAIGGRQAEIYARLIEEQAEDLLAVQSAQDLDALLTDERRVGVIPAIENASAFAEEDEPLDRALDRFDQLVKLTGPVLYVSLTWNTANRFGGGNQAETGLTDDGKALLDFLADRGPALDLSHAGPRLAHDVLDYTYSKGLDLPVIASHSPYAGIVDIPRNLSDETAKEIANRQGVIGLNLLSRFLDGDPADCFVNQLKYAREIGVLDAQVMGADFFYEGDVPGFDPETTPPDFHRGYDNAACYPRLLDDLRQGLDLSPEEVSDLAWGRIERFVKRILPAG